MKRRAHALMVGDELLCDVGWCVVAYWSISSKGDEMTVHVVHGFDVRTVKLEQHAYVDVKTQPQVLAALETLGRLEATAALSREVDNSDAAREARALLRSAQRAGLLA